MDHVHAPRQNPAAGDESGLMVATDVIEKLL
jgi:hypothetical protein